MTYSNSMVTPAGTITSLPVRSNGKDWEVVQGIELNDFAKEKIAASNAELLEEQAEIAKLF